MPNDPEFDAIKAYLESPPAGQPDSRPGYDPALRDAERIFGRDARPRPKRAPFTDLERVFLPENRPFTGLDAQNARNFAAAWEEFDYTADAARGWLKAGLEPHESTLATLLEAEGIRPWMLREVIEHPDTGERLTILDVARRAPQTYVYDKDKTFCDVLDDAGVERPERTGRRRLSKFERRINKQVELWSEPGA